MDIKLTAAVLTHLPSLTPHQYASSLEMDYLNDIMNMHYMLRGHAIHVPQINVILLGPGQCLSNAMIIPAGTCSVPTTLMWGLAGRTTAGANGLTLCPPYCPAWIPCQLPYLSGDQMVINQAAASIKMSSDYCNCCGQPTQFSECAGSRLKHPRPHPTTSSCKPDASLMT